MRESGKPVIGKMVRLSMIVAVLYWVLDAILDSLVFHSSTFVESLIRPDPMCLAMRLINWLLVSAFAGYAQLMLSKREQAQEVPIQDRDKVECYLDQVRKAGQDRELLIDELRDVVAEVRTLGGLLPICSHCKKIRDDKGYWHQVEVYIGKHAGTKFSHGICPECVRRYYVDVAGFKPKNPDEKTN